MNQNNFVSKNNCLIFLTVSLLIYLHVPQSSTLKTSAVFPPSPLIGFV